MITDSIFKIGATHSVCQDYALHNINYAVIADGCSGSPNTDIGARLNVLALAKTLADYPNLDFYLFFAAMQRANVYRESIELIQSVLDSTLGIINRYIGVLYGDGNFIVKYENGNVLLVNVDFTGGYPNYPSYLLDTKSYQTISEMKNNQKIITRTMFDSDFNYLWKSTHISNGDFHREDFYVWNDSKPVMAMVTSDGLQTFQRKITNGWESLPIEDVLRDITAIKVRTNGFLQRRIDRFSEKMIKEGLRHYDDLSIGAILYESV